MRREEALEYTRRRKGGEKMRILVVEDQRDLNRLMVKTLQKEGYAVDGCFDGEEALLHLEGAEYDGVILDVMLPKRTATRCWGSCAAGGWTCRCCSSPPGTAWPTV